MNFSNKTKYVKFEKLEKNIGKPDGAFKKILEVSFNYAKKSYGFYEECAIYEEGLSESMLASRFDEYLQKHKIPSVLFVEKLKVKWGYGSISRVYGGGDPERGGLM